MSNFNPATLAGSKWARRSHRNPPQQHPLLANLPSTVANAPKPTATSIATPTPIPISVPAPKPPTTRTSTSPFKHISNTSNPPLTKTQKSHIQKQTDFDRFLKLQRRLKWKAAALIFCHARALELTQQAQSQAHLHSQPNHPGLGNGSISPFYMEASEAETMFKIDFFEFYVLLERALVHLLGVFGIVVDPSFAVPYSQTLKSTSSQPQTAIGSNMTTTSHTNPSTNNKEGGERIIGDSFSFHGIPHRYHANVLAALDNKSCPLYTIFNTTTSIPSYTQSNLNPQTHPNLPKRTIKSYLLFAKDFRNHWKDVASDTTGPKITNVVNGEKAISDAQTEYLTTKYAEILADLKLEEMVEKFLWALEQGKVLGEGEVQRCAELIVNGEESKDGFGEDMEIDLSEYYERRNENGMVQQEMPYEYTPDQMEMD